LILHENIIIHIQGDSDEIPSKRASTAMLQVYNVAAVKRRDTSENTLSQCSNYGGRGARGPGPFIR